MTANVARCTKEKHVFAPFVESRDLGGGFQRCECEKVAIDRLMSGGRCVLIAKKGERRANLYGG